MLRKFIYLLLFVVVLANTIVFVQPTLAEENCSSAIIDDETGTLDVSAICEAAKQWSDKGISLYILYTKENFKNEDSWFNYLDKKETEIGQRQGSQVKKNFLAFEATSDGQWVTITQGDYVYYETPFDGEVDRIKGVLNNGVIAGDATQAFVDALNEGFGIAFPAPVQQQVQQPQVIIVTSEPVAKEPVELSPSFINGAKKVFFWILGLAATVAFVLYIAIPGGKLGLTWYRKYQHLSLIKIRTAKLLNGLGRLFQGDSIEATLLFQLLESYGIKKYPKANKEVEEWLRRCKVALDESFSLLKSLESDDGKKKSIDQQIKAWETLYLTLVGSDQEILTLTDQQITQLLDPSAGVDTTSVDVQLVEQIKIATKELAGGGYKIEFNLVDPESVDQKGILGYVKQVKDQLAELRKAKSEATPKVKKAKDMLENASGGPFPGKLTAEKVFSKAKILIVEAEQDIVDQSWLTAIRKADNAMELINEGQQCLPIIIQAEKAFNDVKIKLETDDLLPERSKLLEYPGKFLESMLGELSSNNYNQAVISANDLSDILQTLTNVVVMFYAEYKNHQKRLETVVSISKKGFILLFHQKLADEIASDIQKIGSNLLKGNYQQADAMIKELVSDSESLLTQAQTLEALHNNNLIEIKRLSKEVARISEFNLSKAIPSWKLLCEYPDSNRVGIVNIEIPNITLKELFDDPTKSDDLSSKIFQLNSLEKQSFATAKEQLVIAFARLQEAENQLKAIVERLKDVQEAEQESMKSLTLIRRELDNTITKLNEYDKYVDNTANNQIEQVRKMIDQIQKLIDNREYFDAMRLLLSVRTSLKTTLSTINEQAQRILNLLKELESSKAEASWIVDQIVIKYGGLIPVLKSNIAGDNVEKAVQSLREAQKANERLAGLEDHELESAAEKALALYDETIENAREAKRRIELDESEYEVQFNDSKQAISKASQAIASARSIMNDSDAGSAGESAYRRAQEYLPDSLSYGITITQLQQIESSAEQSYQAAIQAERETHDHIEAVEAERRRRQEEEERRRRRQEEEERRRNSYSSSYSGYGSSHSSSSFGSSSRSSSFGSFHSSSSFGGSHR